jgi:hypothetical protein
MAIRIPSAAAPALRAYISNAPVLAAVNPYHRSQDLGVQMTKDFKAVRAIAQLRMVGLMFVTPDTPLATTDVYPRMSKFHARSGKHIDFYFAGYRQGGQPKSTQFVRIEGPKGSWYYSQKDFDRLVSDMESKTTWKYSGDTDLLLMNGWLDGPRSKATLDFKTAIVCQLETMKRDEAFVSVGQFFEQIFRFAESFEGDDPTWGFSDREGVAIAGSALKRFIYSLLPKSLSKDATRAEHFSVRDLAAR